MHKDKVEDGYTVVARSDVEASQAEAGEEKKPVLPASKLPRSQATLFAILAVSSIASALGFSTLQEKVFNIPGFEYAGWMTAITYVTYATCGILESAVTRSFKRNAALRDYALISLLAMAGAYLTNWALSYLSYTTRILFKSCRVIPVMIFRSIVVGQRYTAVQYGAGALLVAGISLFTAGDAAGGKESSSTVTGVVLISIALVCDALTANLEEKQFFRIRTPATHAEVMTYLSLFAAAESFVVVCASGEVVRAFEHSRAHPETVPLICLFSVLGYITVCLILLIIKHFGATNAEVVKSMRKVCQVALSFLVFPKPLSWKYGVGGLLVAAALYILQKTGKKPAGEGQGGAGRKGEHGHGHGQIGSPGGVVSG